MGKYDLKVGKKVTFWREPIWVGFGISNYAVARWFYLGLFTIRVRR